MESTAVHDVSTPTITTTTTNQSPVPRNATCSEITTTKYVTTCDKVPETIYVTLATTLTAKETATAFESTERVTATTITNTSTVTVTESASTTTVTEKASTMTVTYQATNQAANPPNPSMAIYSFPVKYAKRAELGSGLRLQWSGNIAIDTGGNTKDTSFVEIAQYMDLDDIWYCLQLDYPTWSTGPPGQADDIGDDGHSPAGILVCMEPLDQPAGDRNNTAKPTDPEVYKYFLGRLEQIGGGLQIGGSSQGGCHRLGCASNTAIWWCSVNNPRSKERTGEKETKRRPPPFGKSHLRKLTTLPDLETPFQPPNYEVTASSLEIMEMGNRVRKTCVEDQKRSGGFQWFADNHPEAAHTRVVLSWANCDDSLFLRPFDMYDSQDLWKAAAQHAGTKVDR